MSESTSPADGKPAVLIIGGLGKCSDCPPRSHFSSPPPGRPCARMTARRGADGAA